MDMCLTMVLEMMYSSLELGGLSSNSGVGGSVAKANEAKESIIKLTQRS